MELKNLKKIKKCGMACLLAVSLAGTSVVPYAGISVRVEAATKLAITQTNGGMENASVSWEKGDADGYNVYYKEKKADTFIQVDDMLIRQYGTTYRVDIPGLKAGEYQISIVPVKNQTPVFSETVEKTVSVRAHVREGFAFAKSSPTKGEMLGGYQNNGTPQQGAQILYINHENVNTVTLDVITNESGKKESKTGLAEILKARGKGYDKTPLIIRVIGTLNSEDISGINDKGYLEVKGVKNLTIEGIGTDATIYGFGLLLRNSSNIEVSNLALMKFPDDGVSLDTNNQNIWVHNNDFFYGAAGSDADQVKGDGSCDIKGKSTYVTVSYNHFWDSGKCSLCGMNDTEEFFVTYHHNWFDHSDSRHARIRVGSIHLYNNYYDGNAKYGVGVTKGASAFVEKNVFRNCKYPMLSSMQGTDIASGKGTFSKENGGIIKAFDNQITGEKKLVYTKDDATQFDAYLASTQKEKVPDTFKTVQGGTSYNNFDTDSSKFYDYNPTDTDKVKQEVTTYAGRVQGGDVQWKFTDEKDDTDSDINQALMNTINNYKTKLTKIGGNGIQSVYKGKDTPEEPSMGSEPQQPSKTSEISEPQQPSKASEVSEPQQPSKTSEVSEPQQPSKTSEGSKPTETDQKGMPSLSEDMENQMEIGTVGISGGGFVSGIVTGKEVMYARTDVGGAYKYNYDTNRWEQLFGFLTEAERGLLSVDAMCIDPTDDDIAYFLCGCAYFSDAKTVILRTRDGGKTFDEIDVTKLIQVHGNGNGRQFGEAIAVDPDQPNVLYCGGDTGGLIKSTDGGDTWNMVEGYTSLGLFKHEINWPTWTNNKVKTTDTEYYKCNGVGNVAIADGKVYVGTSITGEANVHVADISKDEFTALSDKLPTDLLPSHINKDCEGNLLISYVKGISFDGSAGAGYRYDVKTGELTDISPKSNKGDKPGIGSIVSDPKNPDKLVATSCGLWWGQMWEKDAWEKNKVCYGDITLRSEDGGKTWRQMLPGECSGWGDTSTLMTDYLQDGGHSWIRNKAIHWSGALVLDPKQPNRFFVTSGNGIFACDDVWADIPSIHFQADGIEEVVSLDATCAPDGTFYSVIGDYDGFKHKSLTESIQFSPTMDQNSQAQNASVGAIAYCPSNPDIMVRYSESSSAAYCSKDAGDSWSELKSNISGGKAAIAQLEDNTYRIFRTGNGTIEYTDDFGASWNKSTGTEGSSTLWACVDEKNPKYVYAYGYYFNQYYNGSDKGKDPTIEDARYSLMVSSDYGKTFEKQTICLYDRCDSAYRIAYLDEGKIVLAAGYQGAYLVTDYGKKVTKLEEIPYCKTIGYGAPVKEGASNTLFAWGKPKGKDMEGVYCSTDEGKTWITLDTKKTYGGTGNGNYIVGDKKQFGTFYMSTVGCGIVYGKFKSGGSDQKPTVPDKIKVKEVKLKETAVTMKIGEKKALQYTISPSNASNQKVSWKSDHPEVVQVEKGNITALKEGKAKITVTTEDGKKTSSCTVTVEKAEIQNPSEEQPGSEGSHQDKPSQTRPGSGQPSENEAGSTVEPSSERPSEGKPSEGKPSEGKPSRSEPSKEESGSKTKPSSEQPSEGKTSEGKPGISEPSKGESGSRTKPSSEQPSESVPSTQKPSIEKPSESVPSIQKPSVQKPSIEKPSESQPSEEKPSKIEIQKIEIEEQNLELNIGETKQLHKNILPADATDQTVTWYSASSDIVSVTQDGKIKAEKEGTTVVYIITSNGKIAVTTIMVEKAGSSQKNEISISMPSNCALKKGESKKIDVVVKNADENDLTWNSTNPDIVEVTDGVIIAKKAGTTFITASIGEAIATCIVSVSQEGPVVIKPTVLEGLPKEMTLKAGQKKTLKISVLPKNATNKKVTMKKNAIIAVTKQKGNDITLQAKKTGMTVLVFKVAGNSKLIKKVTVKVKPKAVTKLKAKQIKANKVRLTWRKASGVSAYKIYMSQAGKKKYSVVKQTTGTRCIISGLKKGKSYKFKVRAYKKVKTKRLYSSDSKVVSVKIRK